MEKISDLYSKEIEKSFKYIMRNYFEKCANIFTFLKFSVETVPSPSKTKSEIL